MSFHAFDASIELVRETRSLMEQVRARDPDLERQLRRATSSVSLNLIEGGRRAGRDRLHHFRVAAGSAAEVAACLRVAEAWRYLSPKDISPALAICDRLLAMLWRLTH